MSRQSPRTAPATTIDGARRRRRRLAAFVAFFTMVGVGVAYAWWTGTGTGAGTAETGTAAVVTVNQTSTVSNLRPGGPAQTLSGTFTNASGGNVYVATVTAAIDSVTKAGGAPAGTCDATDYTLASAVATVDADLAEGNAVGSWTGPTIRFNNKATNQDACKGATVNLSYTVN
jgi:hypothetical protein